MGMTQQKIALFASLVVALLGCNTAAPRDAWIGRYRGTVTDNARDCMTGEVLDPIVQEIVVEVVPVGGQNLGINGACLTEFRLYGPTDGRIIPSACGSTLDDGTPVNYEQVSGTLQLDGDELYFDFAGRISTPEFCDTTDSTFIGYRQ